MLSRSFGIQGKPGETRSRGLPLHRSTLPQSNSCNANDNIREPSFKRPFDFLLSAIGLVFLLPLWLLIAGLIWVEDGSPIIFRQRRIGRNGKLFSILKFRSMVKDHEKVEVQASKDDPRITRVGGVLRRTALDELPQLWNIFIGDESFVGPRAQPEKEIVKVGNVERELYVSEVPGYELRQLVRPGLTGIAQIYARREVAHRYKFKYDLIYVRRVMNSVGVLGDIRMFFYDLVLIIQSIWITLRGRWEV